MLQLVLTILMYLIIVIPVGRYLYHIAAGKHTFADPVFDRVDGGIFKVCGIHPDKGMNWKQYTPQAHIGITEMYVADPRFTEYYDKDIAGCAEFLKKAVLCWVGRG